MLPCSCSSQVTDRIVLRAVSSCALALAHASRPADDNPVAVGMAVDCGCGGRLQLNQVNPYAYLVALMRHSEDVASHPAEWLPWNYRDRLSVLEESSADDVASAPESEPAVCD